MYSCTFSNKDSCNACCLEYDHIYVYLIILLTQEEKHSQLFWPTECIIFGMFDPFCTFHPSLHESVAAFSLASKNVYGYFELLSSFNVRERINQGQLLEFIPQNKSYFLKYSLSDIKGGVQFQ